MAQQISASGRPENAINAEYFQAIALVYAGADLAVEHLKAALAQAEALNIRYLATQVRLWLAPLLPPDAARDHLATARQVAEQDGYLWLLEQGEQLAVGRQLPG